MRPVYLMPPVDASLSVIVDDCTTKVPFAELMARHDVDGQKSWENRCYANFVAVVVYKSSDDVSRDKSWLVSP